MIVERARDGTGTLLGGRYKKSYRGKGKKAGDKYFFVEESIKFFTEDLVQRQLFQQSSPRQS